MSPTDDRRLARPPGETADAPRWRRLERDERRSQILDCARRLFAERGYAGVSMADIAACAGVRRGLLHHYFGDKRALYVEVVRDLLGRFAGLLDEAGTDTVPDAGAVSAPIEQQAAERVDRWLDVVEQQGDSWFTIILADATPADGEVRSMVARARAAMVEGVLTTLVPAGAGERARVVLRAYGGLADVVTREWLQLGTIDRPQAHALLTTSLLATVREVLPAVEAAASPTAGHRPPATAGRPEVVR